jgi:hypothetical protein
MSTSSACLRVWSQGVLQITKQAFNSFASAKMTKVKFWANEINDLRLKLFFNRCALPHCTNSDQAMRLAFGRKSR